MELMNRIHQNLNPSIPSIAHWGDFKKEGLVRALVHFSAAVRDYCAALDIPLKRELRQKWYAISVEGVAGLAGVETPVLKVLLYQCLLDEKAVKQAQTAHERDLRAAATNFSANVLTAVLDSLMLARDRHTFIPDVSTLKRGTRSELRGALLRLADWIVKQRSTLPMDKFGQELPNKWGTVLKQLMAAVFDDLPVSALSILVHTCMVDAKIVLDPRSGLQQQAGPSTPAPVEQNDSGMTAGMDQAFGGEQSQDQTGAAGLGAAEEFDLSPFLHMSEDGTVAAEHDFQHSSNPTVLDSQSEPQTNTPFAGFFNPLTEEQVAQGGTELSDQTFTHQPQLDASTPQLFDLDNIVIAILQRRLANISVPTVQDLIDQNVSRDKLFLGFVRALSELVPMCEPGNKNKPEVLAKWKPLKDERDGLTDWDQDSVGKWSVEELREKLHEILSDAWDVQTPSG